MDSLKSKTQPNSQHTPSQHKLAHSKQDFAQSDLSRTGGAVAKSATTALNSSQPSPDEREAAGFLMYCNRVVIGKWHWLCADSSQLRLVFSPDRACLEYHMTDQSIHYVMQYSFAYIQAMFIEVHKEWLTIRVTQPPVFFRAQPTSAKEDPNIIVVETLRKTQRLRAYASTVFMET